MPPDFAESVEMSLTDDKLKGTSNHSDLIRVVCDTEPANAGSGCLSLNQVQCTAPKGGNAILEMDMDPFHAPVFPPAVGNLEVGWNRHAGITDKGQFRNILDQTFWQRNTHSNGFIYPRKTDSLPQIEIHYGVGSLQRRQSRKRAENQEGKSGLHTLRDTQSPGSCISKEPEH